MKLQFYLIKTTYISRKSQTSSNVTTPIALEFKAVQIHLIVSKENLKEILFFFL